MTNLVVFTAVLASVVINCQLISSRPPGDPILIGIVKPLIKDSPKGGQPGSVQRTNSMPPIALPIEIVHLEPPSNGHLSHYSGQRTASVPPEDSNLYKITPKSQKRTETKAASINHKNLIPSNFLIFVTQIVCPLLCFVDFSPCRVCLID